jgi:ABC-type transport system involved in multi-copper enzyme maturation permease subunit
MNSRTLLIARYTLKEILQSKILIAIVILAFLIGLFSFVASEFSYGAPAKVALDFGLGLLSFSLYFISIFIGAFLLKREADNRTLYLLLSRPVKRFEFFLGKMGGLALFLALVTLILTSSSYLMYALYGGTFSSLFFYTSLFSYLKSLVLFSLVVFFSLIISPALNIFISISIWLCAYGITPALELNYVRKDEFVFTFLRFVRNILPDFHSINLSEVIIYDLQVADGYVIKSLIYLLSYLMLITALNYVVVQKKNFD